MFRRTFLGTSATGILVEPAVARALAPPKTFGVWVMGCSHVGTDLSVGKRESLADAIRQSEFGGSDGGPPFDWDIALNLGDLSGAQSSPKDPEGVEVVRQYAVAKKHRREQFYDVAGNHDASGPGEPTMTWFQKWIDPEGQHTDHSRVAAAQRPYPIEGTWERYAFRVGNLLFLMMSDRNDGGPPVGRGARGGYPAGAVTGETFAWWQKAVEANRDAVIVSAHHHMLKETTVASGAWEGFSKETNGQWKSKYHGYFPDGGPEGASYLYFVDDKPDAQRFENYLAQHPSAIDFWLGAHTHTNPDDKLGGRSHVERKWGATFVNCAALARYHGRSRSVPMSRLLTFTEGSSEVRIQCYLHTSDHARQGWYEKAERTAHLSKPFRLS